VAEVGGGKAALEQTFQVVCGVPTSVSPVPGTWRRL
jgi:hypothetical protein